MDYWKLARQAIEEMVAEQHPESIDEWSAIVPMNDQTGWGLDLATWATEANIIADNFEGLIGEPFEFSDEVIIAAGNRALDDLQAYMAAKFEYSIAAPIFYSSRAVLVRWER